MPEMLREQLYPLGFQCGNVSWERLELNNALLSTDAEKLFFLRQMTAAELQRTTSDPLSAGELQLWGVLNSILQVLGRSYLAQHRLDFPPEVQASLLGTLQYLVENFPVVPGKSPETVAALRSGHPSRIDFFVVELCLLSLQSSNHALRDGRSLFSRELASLRDSHPFDQIILRISQHIPASAAGFGNRSLLDLLQEPLAAAPDNLAGQLAFLRQTWGDLLPTELLVQIDAAIAIHRDELRERGPVGAPAPDLPGFVVDGEAANFTPDRDWMPRTVMLAKAVFVWLYQLSERYGREIRRLDQIPDEELDSLRAFGFSGLWLIGIWQRSEASRRIKHLHGRHHVSASAYAIHDYRIADELGGEAALDNLKSRCEQRGIHLACDVVTNHTGIDSQWMRQHPEWFIQATNPPYPGYSYSGSDLSGDSRLCIQIEDGYYNHSEAAVVFCRRDLHSGEVRYIYHGNDGTHLPWNDTAQLNFLLPQVREAMIGVILETAKRFGIIRFDAAMTLAKKHFQRLWYPLPDGGEGIPSRSAWALSNQEFDQLFPVEFWREVVERIKAEQPDTLLVAEAFWLMEGYFVRTLGMHRVYNSAFMNMLKREDNSNYRKTLSEILAFDPAILQRFVNFMSNPDEETAIEQFGNSDKYFCVATLLCTMPGLPLFAHGQLEGLREKYGMEYSRPEWHEETDQRLLNDHWRQIAPLLRERQVFSGAEDFQLYDFISEHGIEEAVYAYSNAGGGRQVLVLCNNSPHRIQGHIGSAVHSKTAHKSLREALDLREEQGFYCCGSLNSPLEYLRPATGQLYFDLPPYAHIVLDRFQHRRDEEGRWARLQQQLGLQGATDLAARTLLLDICPLLSQLSEWLKPGSPLPDMDQDGAGQLEPLLTGAAAIGMADQQLLRKVASIWFEPALKISDEALATACAALSDRKPFANIIRDLFNDAIPGNLFIQHEYEGKIWFKQEPLAELGLLFLLQIVNTGKSCGENIGKLAVKTGQAITDYRAILRLAERSSYLRDDFLQGLSAEKLSLQQKQPQSVTTEGSRSMKILFVSSEATPFAKTGGLADVVGSLPRALRQLGHDVQVIMPCYGSTQRNGFALAKEQETIEVNIGGETIRAGLRQAIRKGVTYHFIEAPEYFDRKYLYGTPDGDYQDNAQRFSFFCRAVLEYLPHTDYKPDILHLHDWQTSLIPALLKTEYATEPFFASTATVLTIHNLGYQGIFPLSKVKKLGLPQEFTSPEHLEYFNNISLLKGGIVHADLINTVSKTYCQEIQQVEQGHGFDGLLRSRSRDLYGILNGIIEKDWDPTLDSALHKPFSSANLTGKRNCKRALQKELGLEERHDIPLIAVVSRLDRQKGIDLIEEIWPQLMQRDLQFVLIGSGDKEQMAFWQERQQETSAKVAICLQFDEDFSRRIYSSADSLLIPSLYEPCGLTQMIALRYGALPIVRHTGGLADTVIDLEQHPESGNGFVFRDSSPEALLKAIDRALELYSQRKRWLSLVKRGMEIDFGWEGSAQRYEEIYRLALNKRRDGH
jgi:ADP-glucose type glycogen/starch synthase